MDPLFHLVGVVRITLESRLGGVPLGRFTFQPEGVGPCVGIGDIGGWVRRRGKSKWVEGEVAGGFGVVVAEVVVVKARFRVVVLAREA
jgi:hypothetical protein